MKDYGLVAGLPVRYKVTRTTSTDMFFVSLVVTLLAGIYHDWSFQKIPYRTFAVGYILKPDSVLDIFEEIWRFFRNQKEHS